MTMNNIEKKIYYVYLNMYLFIYLPMDEIKNLINKIILNRQTSENVCGNL